MTQLLIFKDEMNVYGVDWFGPTPSQEWGTIETEADIVVVPGIVLPYPNHIVQYVCQHLQAIDPLGESTNFGIDVYEQAVRIISSLTAQMDSSG